MKRVIKIILLVLLLATIAFADDGEEIWMGWVQFESGSETYESAASDNGHAYGLYQFDIRYSLPEFLQKCVQEDATAYEKFNHFIAISNVTGDNEPLLDARNELSAVWKEICAEQGESFYRLQDKFSVNQYYYPSKSYLMTNYNIDLDKYGPILKGTVWSVAIRDGGSDNRNLSAVINTYSPGISEKEWVEKIHMAEAQKHPTQSSRWSGEQLDAALNAGDTDTMTFSYDGSFISSSSIAYSFDGSAFKDYVGEWFNKYKNTVAKPFIDSGGWTQSNKSWAYSLRGYTLDSNNKPKTTKIGDQDVRVSNFDFNEMYGINGNPDGGKYSVYNPYGYDYYNFTAATGGGIYSSVSVNAETKKVPDNDSNNAIVYFGQSVSAGGGEWARVKFGGRDIGYSGCSITSFAMVVSYLKSGTGSSGWVYPPDVVNMIAAKNNGNYNKFYVDGVGQSWDIFSNLASYYNVNCRELSSSSSSLISALKAGHPVIMSCNKGEFTSGGHFIVITGIDSQGYLYVNDPSHPDKSYNKYTASYLIGQGKGWWEFY